MIPLLAAGSDQDRTSEQGDAANGFLGHAENESEYFLLLIQLARAGTESFREFTRKRMRKLKTQRLRVAERLGIPQKLALEQQTRYYGSWKYAAIHMATTIPGEATADAIARRLGLPVAEGHRALRFLVACGLVARRGDSTYAATTQRIHLGEDSELIASYHQSWRMQAMRAIERADRRDLHYSSAVTLAPRDAQRIRALLVDALEKSKTTVQTSPAEALYALSLDWYAL